MFSLARLTATKSLLGATALAALLALSPVHAQAASDIFAPGKPIITGFPGVVIADEMPDGSDELDYTFIDLEGHSLAIQDLLPDAPPEGQLIDTPTLFGVTAADVGLVYGVTFDNAPDTTGADAPNIYVAATSAYGLYLVNPDADGNPVRTRTGDPEAEFMSGQWGGAGGDTGYPGSIWKIDGETGEVSLFTTIAVNSGASLGDIAFDPDSQQFFVSDLDTGLIYRLADDGTIMDTFDHGVDGRPAHELDPVEDDGAEMDITDAAFNSEDPSTWGFTQPERKVQALAPWNGRLYYTAQMQVFSVRINDDGSFGSVRWELDVTDLPSANDLKNIVFDSKGRMILAQRGNNTGAFDYMALVEAGTSSVVRYEREFPDDETTPGIWTPEADSYAIGVAAEGMNASGGLAMGYGFDVETEAFDGALGTTLWATGDSLRDNADLDPPLDGPAYVAGLQGVPRSWVRPLNDPPTLSAFTDFDGNTEDDQAGLAGHVGDVAMWLVSDGVPTLDPDEPIDLPPDDYEPSPEANLSLEKWSSPFDCFDVAAEWWCKFTIRVENTGDVPYWGPISIVDHLPANNPGASLHFWPSPTWSCGPTGPTSAECSRGPVLLFPGDGVTLNEIVKLPKALVDYCHLVNAASINWPFGLHDDDPSDDFDIGVASIAAPACVPPGGGSDLLLTKSAFPNCFDIGTEWACHYVVNVQNVGPGNFTGPITVEDTLAVNAPMTVGGPWTCGQVGPVLTCNINAPPVNVPPGWSSAFVVTATIDKAGVPPLCDLDNRANIAFPVGGPSNFDATNDFDDASAFIPDPGCFVPAPVTDIEIKKQAQGCGPFGPDWICEWKLTVKNVGPNLYFDPLHFEDTSIFAALNTLPGAAPFCVGGPGVVDCDIPLAFMPPGVPFTYTFYTGYIDGPDVCSANNTATVIFPNPGSPQNPNGNDSSTVGQAIPNPACAGLPVLNIKKTAKGCDPDPSSPDWLCVFDIKVKNLGGVPQPGPITFRDFNDKPTTFNSPACVPAGVGQWDCTRAAALNPLATWTVQATTRVDPNGVTLADCNVINTVIITNPASWSPGHFSQAEQKVPQLFINLGPGPFYVYCDPPSLKLEKTATKTVESGDGYDATFRIKATSTGPDPYVGTVELDEILPDGTEYVSSSWPCAPTTGNDLHCSSPHKVLPVGSYTAMTITIHIPEDVAKSAKCQVVNTVNAAISAEVLHSDEGAQYTASAAAKLPADVCREEPEPQQCEVNQQMPNGDCCEGDEVWNGRQCAPPKDEEPEEKTCPRDSVLNNAGECVCKRGTEGEPGECEEIVEEPTCPRDSVLNNAGECVCKRGTEGEPGDCEEIVEEPTCPRDSVLNNNGECVCKRGTEGEPGDCEPIVEEPTCPKDSVLNNRGDCVCKRGTEGEPGDCEPIVEEPTCPKDSVLNNRGDCVCKRGTVGEPGECQPEIVIQICPDDSVLNNALQCVCKRGTTGEPGNCQAPEPEPEQKTCPKDSVLNRQGECVCRKGTEGEPGKCQVVLNLDLGTIKVF
jgi:hypothetical protein